MNFRLESLGTTQLGRPVATRLGIRIEVDWSDVATKSLHAGAEKLSTLLELAGETLSRISGDGFCEDSQLKSTFQSASEGSEDTVAQDVPGAAG